MGFYAWATLNRRPATARATDLLAQNSVVRDENDWLVFRPNPTTTATDTALIYYPGGLVEPEAYAVTAQGIADAGYTVIVPDMPLNLAVLGISAADDILDAYSDVETWVVGGHSLGGAMAAQYALTNAAAVDGLIFFASNPADSAEFTTAQFPILSIYGSQDLGLEGIEASEAVLGDVATFIRMEGGNHAQFGDYGPQEGDGVATVSVEDQQARIIDSTIVFLDSLVTE